MEPLSLRQVAEATGGTLVRGDAAAHVLGVSTDSRGVSAGDLFVCLEGPRFDGHVFAAEAIAAGAVAVLGSRDAPDVSAFVRVQDPLAALGALGRTARFRAPDALVVGITGTNGKTSTKELVAAVLGARLATVASRRSFNNAIGVPLTLLDIDRTTEAAVVEMGSNAPGEIAQLAALVQPQVGIITNVQRGHLAGLGSMAGVREEKGSLLDGLTGRAVSILNFDDPSFEPLGARAPGPVIGFGFGQGADVRATEVASTQQGTRFLVGGRHEVRLQLFGRHAVGNALAALSVALVAGIPLPDAIEALAEVPPPPGRLAVRRQGDLTLIDDTYNSNPGSLAAALATLAELRLPGRLVAVIGDMRELGDESEALHREAGRQLQAARPALVVAVGRHAESLLAGARQAGLAENAALCCSDSSEAADRLAGLLQGGDVVLLKGSRSVHLETIVARLSELSVGVA